MQINDYFQSEEVIRSQNTSPHHPLTQRALIGQKMSPYVCTIN